MAISLKIMALPPLRLLPWQVIAGLVSERDRLSAELRETTATLEVQLADVRKVLKGREDDLETASEQLENAQVLFPLFQMALRRIPYVSLPPFSCGFRGCLGKGNSSTGRVLITPSCTEHLLSRWPREMGAEHLNTLYFTDPKPPTAKIVPTCASQ